MSNKSLVRALPYAGQIKLRGIILTIVLIGIKMEDYHHGNKAPWHKRLLPFCHSLYTVTGLHRKWSREAPGQPLTWTCNVRFLSPQPWATPPCTHGNTIAMRPEAFSQGSELEFSPPVTGWPVRIYSSAGCNSRFVAMTVIENRK